MNFSAASSRSPVVTPGRALPWSMLRHRARTRPAAAIFSISSGDFWMITRLQLRFELQRCERSANVVVDLVGRAVSVEAPQQVLLLVPLDQRLSLLVVHVQPLLHGLRLVVVALDQLGAIQVARALVLGRVEVDVVDVTVLGAD